MLVNKKEYLLYLLFVITSTVFLYFFSYGTSPFFPTYGGDSEIFILVGKAITQGKILYKDIFDHKGPILFFINALGYKIAGINGIFFLQIINLTLIQILVFRISQLFIKSKLISLIPVSSIFILFAYSIDDGNVSEEYSIPFVLLSLYLFVKYMITEKKEHPSLYAFIYGFCLGVIALIRLNNGVAIGCIVLAIVIQLITQKHYKNLYQNAIAFIGGLIVIFLITSIYFIVNNSFSDFIYATFTFNFKYSHSYPKPPFFSAGEIKNHIITLLPILLLFVSTFIYRKKLNNTFIISCLLIGLLTFVAISIGGALLHYQMLNIVPLVLAIIISILIIRDNTTNQPVRTLIISLCILLGLFYTYKSRKIIYTYKDSYNLSELYNSRAIRMNKQLVNQIIPINERNSVFGYNVRSYWFLETDILPSYKYFTNQELWVMVDKDEVYEGINEYLTKTPPKWIVLPKYHLISWMKGVDDNPILKELLENDYHMIADDTDYLYYRHN
jgi:hypothetical protein